MLKNRIHKRQYPKPKKSIGRKTLMVFMIVLIAFFVFVGINAKAFIFGDKNETVEIYSLEANGDWENEFQAVMLPEVGEEDETGYFSGSNSAIYEGESREIILSDFSATRDELEGLTEDEEIINNLQHKTGWDSPEFHESILEQETGAPQPDLDLLGTDNEEKIVQEPEETPEEIKEETSADTEQKEPGNFLEIAPIDTAYLNARDESFLEGNIISKVKAGEIYEYTEEKDGWYKIKINEKKSGWVFGEYVILKTSPENIESMEENSNPADLSSITKSSSVIATRQLAGKQSRNSIASSRQNGIAAVIPTLHRNSLAMTNFGRLIKLFKGNKAEAKNKVNFGDLVGKEFTGAKIKMSLAIVETPEQTLPEEEELNEIPIEENFGASEIIPPDESEPEPILQEEPENETTELESENSPDESVTSYLIEKIKSLLGTSKASAEEESAGEENKDENGGTSFDTDIDAKIIIWYSLDGENWEKLDTITQSSTSNLQNGGYFSFDAPFLKNWQDLKNLRVKLEGAVGGETNFTAYLDSVWAEVEYQDAETEKKNPQMRLPKKDWQKSEQPQLEITNLVEDKSILEETWEGATSVFSGDSTAPEIKVKLTSPAGEEIELEKDKDFTVVENQNPVEIEILPDENLPPGKYAVEVSVNKEGEEYSFNDEFTWGVLAVNVNKSVYLPGETAYVQIAALDEAGHTLCDADLKMEIRDPDGNAKVFKTSDGTIEKSDSCGPDNVTDQADYFFYYETKKEGRYEIKLTNLGNGYEITDSFEVRDAVPFEVERVSATRINPFKAEYVMTINIKANQDFDGSVVESVPESFAIEDGNSDNADFSVSENGNRQYITWELSDVKKGDSFTLKYKYQAPKISPRLFTAGPLKIFSEKSALRKLLGSKDKILFEETRQWQIAADAASDEGILGFGETAADDNMQFLTYVSPSTYTDRGNSVDVTTETNDINHVVVKSAPTRDEIMAGHLKVGGLFNVIKCGAGCTAAANWSEQLEITAVSAAQTCDATAGACEQVFDIAYEQVSGRTFVAYGKAAGDGIIYYNIWNGSSWAGETNFTFNSGSVVDTRWVRLVARGEQSDINKSNEILLLVEDANSDIFAARWDGDSFENLTTITTNASVANRRPFDGAWESNSTHAVVVYAEGTANTTTPFKYKEFDGTSWDSSGTNLPAITSSIGAWVEMASNPQSNRLAVALEHFSTAAVTTGMFAPVIWKADGSTEGWTLGTADTTLENPIAKSVAVAWENYNAGTAFAMFLIANDGTADVSTYETWTAGVGFSALTDMPGGGDDDAKIWKLFGSPNSDEMMAILVSITSDMCVQRWSGTAWDADCSVTEYSTTIPPDSTVNNETNSFNFAYKNVYVQGSLGKTSDGWAGAVPVYLKLGGLNQADYPYARASTTPAVGSAFYTTMTWSAANDRFEGTIYPGSNYCNGCADPNTGTFTVTVQLDNNSDFSSIDYSASAGTFTTYITRRWNAINNTAMGNSTEFNPTWNAGGWWDYSIEDLSVNAAATYSNVAIAIPFHPTTASITNMAVTLAGVSLSQGTAASTTDCWWWDSEHHTLYVQDDSLGTTYKTITLNFDSDTDLFATRIDQVETYNMGVRLFYNGLMWGNNYIGTGMFGGGHEGAGEQMELQARDFATNNDVSVDCMERVAVHVDNVINADASAYYSANIKWKQQEWASYIISENNNEIVTRVTSDGAASGWEQQLDTGIAAQRDQTFYANKRYIKNEYKLTNNGAATRVYPLVWGREQWIGTDKELLDEGRFDGDTVDRTPEVHVAISGLTDPWMTAYDTGVFAAMGMCFQKNDPARYGYFLTLAAITNATPFAEWVNQGTEYRPDDNDAGTLAIDTFFDKNYPSVAPSGSVDFTFWQWGYDTTSWANIESAISADCAEVNPTGVTVSGTVYTDEAKTIPIADGRTVHLFVNSTDYSTTTTSSGAYSFSTVTVAAGDSVIVYLDGVAEDGSTVTLAVDSTTAIANLDIITAHISLEHRAAGPITNTDLDDIDGVDAGDEDGITISSGNAAFADNFELSIVSGENYTPGGTVTCDDFEVEGTGTFAPGANAVTVSGDWEMSATGTFTTSGTVTFDGALAQTIITGTKAFSGLTINNTGTDGANDDVTISGALDINGTFSITNGDLKLNTNNPNVNTAGDVTIGSSAFVTKGTGTWTFDTELGFFTDSSSGGPQDLGAVVIDNGTVFPSPPPPGVITDSNIKVTTLNIHSTNDALNISNDTLTITGSGTPFTQGGMFDETGSTVIYAGTSATNITTAAYHNLTLTPASGSATYSLLGDLTSGNAMTGNMTISSGATLDTTVSSYDITLAGSWSNSGTFTRNSSIVTFNGTTAGLTISDGGSAFYDLVFNGSGGEWLYTNGASAAPTNSTSVSAGTPTFLNARTGTVSVTSGTLNVDWYLGTHAVNAAATGTNIDTGDADIVISEAGSASTVWRHNGSVWGTAAVSQTTGTGSDGKNPQPNSSGAIRIREYSMTASASCPGAGCTLYRYNEQIVWVSTYGEYDYYDDYGENYLTSCWAGSTSACSNDTVDDDVIGSGWYRAASGTMNGTQPYSGLNSPPLEGSWYVGMLEAINFDIDSFSKDFGTITPGANPAGDLTNTLTVTTSASHGYVIYAREEQPMTCSNSAACGTADIDDWPSGNGSPTTWSAGSFGFGYSTNDYSLQGGTADRFSGPKFAGFITTGFGDPVADRTGPSSAQANIITYRIAAQGAQNAGPYQTSIYYVVVPVY